ncbi:MAG: hypothetical protein II242_04850 [Peptococcaceae bacterium]|nr:hypothetical protein [Peptococcaceae bacterium]
MATTEPQKWSATLGASADVNALPETTPSGSGRASTSGLFPPVTQLPLDQGGIAPERGDFNALFKYLGEYLFYLMQGGTFSYSTDYDYTAGNLVMHEGSLYLCIASNGPGSAVKYPTDADYWRQLALTSQLPTVNNGTLTIQNNGATVATFSANQAGNTTANISVPAVNNGALVIQKNGEYVATFRANQSGDTVANITVQASGPGAFDIGSTIIVGMGYDRYLNYGAIIPGGTERGWCPDDHGGALSGWINIPGTWVCCVGPGNNSNVRGCIMRRIA